MPFSQGLTRAQGDPGFFGTLGRLIKGVVTRIPGPIGLVAGTILGRGGRPMARQMVAQTRPAVPSPGLRGVIQRTLPFGATGFECPPGMACPKGMRLNKSDYFLRDGTFVAAGSRCVRIRRTNPANARALGRAQRREAGFMKLALRTGLVRFPKATATRKKAKK